MLHLRVICPSETTTAVLGVLEGCSGTAHVVVHRGAAVTPEGDLVEADLARESADEVLDGLGDLGVDHSGAVTLEVLDTVLSDAADAATARAPGDPADAVVWEELIARTGEDSRPTVTFFSFLTLACLIAVVGIVTNSPVTVVGAMAVGPEFGPLAALAMGLVLRRRDLTRQAALALGIGFPLAILATAAGVLVCEWTGLITVSALDAADQVDFIYQVGPFSLIVALLAGAAGMLSLTSAKSAALVGVFISVTTVPAAAFAVVAATTGDWPRALESLLQLGLNLVGIVVAAAGVLLLRTRRSNGMRRLPAPG